MAKASTFGAAQYTLLLRTSEGGHLSGMLSIHDITTTRRIAQSALRLEPKAAMVDIHRYTINAVELYDAQPLETVTLDTELD